MKKIPQNHAQNNFSHQNLSVKNNNFAMVHILKYLLFMTKVPLGNLIKILAPYFNYLYGQKCIRVLSSMQSFGKKYQSVHQQIKVKYIEEEEEVTLPMHAIYVCFASI